MKKTHNINLGGYPFTIDDDAYKQLDVYLMSINRHFSKSEGCDEIMADIEVRMAELFTDELNSQPIISQKHLDSVINIMGKPEQFGAETIHQRREKQPDDSPREEYKTGKRLFRDLEDRKLGGVCSGLAAYFGIHDPLIVRIATLVLGLGLGIPILFYLVLWALVPVAKTASDRLAMQGKPINVDSIGKIIEEEIQSFSDTVNDLKDEFKSKKK